MKRVKLQIFWNIFQRTQKTETKFEIYDIGCKIL